MERPESRMEFVNSRLDGLRSDAERARMAKQAAQPGEVTIAVSGRHLHFGSLVVVFGRMLREEGTHV